MNEHLKSARDCLNIENVVILESKSFVNSDIDAKQFSSLNAAIQGYRYAGDIKSAQLTDTTNETTFWSYRITYNLGIRAVSPDETEEALQADNYLPLVEINAVFIASYIANRELSEEELSAYCENNVGYHVWPYWREFVQSSCARSGINPVFEIPVYIIEASPSQK